MLTLEESEDKKAGNQSAGVARQYLRTFSPKSQLEALRAKSNGLPFHVVGLERPRMGVPEKPLGHRGQSFSRQQVLSGVSPVGVRQLRAYPDLEGLRYARWNEGP